MGNPGEVDKTRCAPIQALIGKGILEVTIYGLGGHEGECIGMSLKNPSTDTAFIRIEPGRVLSSLDTATQDILITREELFALAPGEQRLIDLYGFCCEALNASPDSAQVYRVGEMADSAVVALAVFLDEHNNQFPENAIQHAIWCLTDDYSIDGIYTEDLASVSDLVNMVASLKDVDEEWHFIENVPEDGARFSHHTRTISGEIELFIPEDCIVNIYICDEQGQKWDEFEKNVAYKAGMYQYSFKLTVTNWPRGKYFIYVKAGSEFLYKKEFEI